LHVALGSAWIFLVSGEMVGTQSGLGYMIIDARNNLRMDYLLAAMVMIGVIGFILDALIGKFEKTVMKAWGKA
jgi:NitT/TauT family transport system permease protein